MKEVSDNELSEDGQVHSTSLSVMVLSISLQLLLTARGLLASLGYVLLEFDAGWLLSGSTELQICCALFHPSRHDGSLPLVARWEWGGRETGSPQAEKEGGRMCRGDGATLLPSLKMLVSLSSPWRQLLHS